MRKDTTEKFRSIESMNFNDLKDGDRINVDYWHLTKTGNGATCDIRGPSETYFTIKNDGENYDFITKEGNKEIRLSQKDCAVAYHKNLESLIFVRLLENDDKHKPSVEVHILSNIIKIKK